MSVLEAAFSQSPFPNQPTLEQLAQQTGLDIRKLRNWFFRKREKTKKKMKKGIKSKEEGTETNG